MRNTTTSAAQKTPPLSPTPPPRSIKNLPIADTIKKITQFSVLLFLNISTLYFSQGLFFCGCTLGIFFPDTANSLLGKITHIFNKNAFTITIFTLFSLATLPYSVAALGFFGAMYTGNWIQAGCPDF